MAGPTDGARVPETVPRWAVAALVALAFVAGALGGALTVSIAGGDEDAERSIESSPAPAVTVTVPVEASPTVPASCVRALEAAADTTGFYAFWTVQLVECGPIEYCTASIRRQTQQSEAKFDEAADACLRAAGQ